MKLDLEAIAKDAAERVHKNGGCVPQLSFAPILFALQDALSLPAGGEGEAWLDELEKLADAAMSGSIHNSERLDAIVAMKNACGPATIKRLISAARKGGETEPCGGCGESDPEKRCIGCLHDFNTKGEPK